MPRKSGKPADVLAEFAESDTPAENDAPATASPTKADDAFATLEDVQEYLRLVYFGREGSGKTSAALDATSEGKVLVINAEGGLKKKALLARGVDVSRVEIWPNPANPVPITHRSLDRLFRRLKAAFAEDPNAFYLVVIDSSTEVNLLLTNSVSDDRVKKDAVTDPFDKFFTDRSDYGTSGKMFRDLLRKFRSLPCHLVITALERRDEDEDTKKVTYGPNVSPAVQTDLAGQMDVILYTREGSGNLPYRALVRGVSKYRTKDRFGSLPDVLAEPSFTRVLAYVEGDLDEKADDLQQTLTPKKKRENTENTDTENTEE